MGRSLLAFLVLLFPSCASADVALLLHESTGIGAARYTSAGHTSVYLSNVCVESPVSLRLCRPEEAGSVISNYSNFEEMAPYEWNVAPLTVYLYGVEDPADIPLYANAELRKVLQEAYRQKYLSAVCSEKSCISGEGRWGDMAGQTFTRDIYAFRVKTTPEQDEALIARYNSLPNVNHYRGFTRNCADFARAILNQYFPHSAKPDHLNDFGMTSPKAIAKSFSHYGEKRPELEFSVEKYSQLAGPIRRSEDNRKGTEAGFRVKKWTVPLLWFRSHELGMCLAAYLITGRFNPQHEFENYPNRQVAELNWKEAQLRMEGHLEEIPGIEEAKKAERDAAVGDQKTWQQYQNQFAPIAAEAIQQGVFSSHNQIKRYFKTLDREGKPELDINGTPLLRIGNTSIGLTRRTILQPGSDRLVAYKLMLAKVKATLAASRKNRETLPEFQADWEILQSLRGSETATRTGTATSIAGQN